MTPRSLFHAMLARVALLLVESYSTVVPWSRYSVSCYFLGVSGRQTHLAEDTITTLDALRRCPALALGAIGGPDTNDILDHLPDRLLGIDFEDFEGTSNSSA